MIHLSETDIPLDWTYDSIENGCIKVTSGGTPSRKNKNFYINGVIPWVKTKELEDGYIQQTEESITHDAINNSSAKILPGGTILLAMYGATVGMLGITQGEMACNQACCALITDSETLDKDFLFYFLLSNRKNLINLATGAAQQNISGALIKEIAVPRPDIIDQRKIGKVLRTLDDKIELNQKMNQTLEEIAKAIFKSWFVDFDPVRAKAEGRPTGLPPEISDLFPDELVDSEIGEIPKGWEIGSISDFAFLNKKTVNPSQSPEMYEHFSIPAFDSGQSPVLDLGTDIKSNKTLVVESSLLVSKLNPNTPRVWLPNSKDLYEQICSTEFMVYTATDRSNITFLWGLFTSSVVAERMKAMVTGTSKSHQRVKPNDVSNITTVMPDARLIKIYGDTVLPMLNRTLVGKSESIVVAELRNTLLPKLISGELRIPDAEKFLEEAGI